jgi:large subunit ribosomal protein L5
MTERRTKRAAAVEEPVASDDNAIEEPVAAGADAVTELAADTESAVAETATEIEAPAEDGPVAAAESAPEAEAAPAAPEAEPEVAPEPETEPIAAAVEEPAAEPADAAAPAPKGKAAPRSAPAPSGPRGLRIKYDQEVAPALTKQFEYGNPNMVPRVSKIVVNIGLGEALTNAKAVDAAAADLATITGQKPIVMKARRSIAQFKIRTGNPIGLKVTLRGQRMWDFLERLTMLALPRLRDFRGTPSKSFDGRGNYTLGLREQIAFPEIDYDKVDRLRGLEVSIVTTAKSDEESKRLLELLGMPFAG